MGVNILIFIQNATKLVESPEFQALLGSATVVTDEERRAQVILIGLWKYRTIYKYVDGVLPIEFWSRSSCKT